MIAGLQTSISLPIEYVNEDAGLVADGDYYVYIEISPIDGTSPLNVTEIKLMSGAPAGNEDDGSILRVNLGLVNIRNTKFNYIRRPFPNIMLPDSSDHEGCKGSLVYSVRSSYALTPGTTVTNRAGIYFDFNEVVMTNTAYSLYPNPVSVADATSLPVQVFPNPVSNTLHVDVAGQDYSHLVVYDVVGRQVREHSVSSGTNTIDVKSLPSGSYYSVLSGAAGKQAFKFTKQ
jgi:hypothetical protein